MILGIDEVGRGPWAGPLVVGAVVLGGIQIDGLTDSKKLSKKRREELSDIIYKNAASVALGWVDAGEIDEVGLSEALRIGARRAAEQVATPYHEIVIDGTINFLAGTSKGKYVTTLPKADMLVPSVSAASIVAKVARDRYMADQDVRYPKYGFKSHVGYGVAKHRAAIEQFGVTPLHRLSFAPLATYRTSKREDINQRTMNNSQASARQVGNDSETVACNYLIRCGHDIIRRNWRTKWCEIDIISRCKDTLYFVEVKHRNNAKSGDGIDAITPKKLAQMKFAAELYTANQAKIPSMRLAVIATSHETPEVVNYLEIG